ncbi:MG284/MPN403 family protein [Mycoplasma corogypsi]|uniref:MG284/MPN403 family protein n=1 Tax=Mycoplasma corogypsi TaxID=2106 RepID=UPI0038732F9B
MQTKITDNDNKMVSASSLQLEKKLVDQQLVVVNEIFKAEKLYNQIIKEKLLILDRLRQMQQITEDKYYDLKNNLEDKISDANSIAKTVIINMGPQNKWMMEKCFIEQAELQDKKWYEEYFSKSTYYKRKREAITEFLSFYFNHAL